MSKVWSKPRKASRSGVNPRRDGARNFYCLSGELFFLAVGQFGFSELRFRDEFEGRLIRVAAGFGSGATDSASRFSRAKMRQITQRHACK